MISSPLIYFDVPFHYDHSQKFVVWVNIQFICITNRKCEQKKSVVTFGKFSLPVAFNLNENESVFEKLLLFEKCKWCVTTYRVRVRARKGHTHTHSNLYVIKLMGDLFIWLPTFYLRKCVLCQCVFQCVCVVSSIYLFCFFLRVFVVAPKIL